MRSDIPQEIGRAVLNRDAMVYPTLRGLIEDGYLGCQEEVVDGQQQHVCRLTRKGIEVYVAGARAWNQAR